MLAFATDWATLSTAATALGTLVLAVATFASVRSAGRSARISEMTLREQLRPVLTHSRITDAPQKMMFIDQHWVRVEGGRATAEHIDGIVYLAISLRNVGSGMAVCQGWSVAPSFTSTRDTPQHAPLDQFRVQARDLYIPPNDIGMWQGALRDPNDPVRAMLAEAIDNGEAISIEVLYSDLVGGQRTVTRFGLMFRADADEAWFSTMSRHWHLDHDGPRQSSEASTATQELLGHLRRRDESRADDGVR